MVKTQREASQHLDTEHLIDQDGLRHNSRSFLFSIKTEIDAHEDKTNWPECFFCLTLNDFQSLRN